MQAETVKKCENEHENEIQDLPSSKLGTKDYWDQIYAMELENFTDHGDEGEIWFGKAVERKVLDWIKKNTDASVRILDLGCGNGHFILKLIENGIDNVVGLDYSKTALLLAKNLFSESKLSKELQEPDDRFFAADILNVDSVPKKLLGSFDLIVDKGTFDAISLNPEITGSSKTTTIAEAFKSTLRKLILPTSPHKLFIITSCNWTSQELISLMLPEFKSIAEIEHTKFVFGGKSGQDVSSVIFKLEDS